MSMTTGDDSGNETGGEEEVQGGEFPSKDDGFVNFGWEDDKPLAGRRKAAEKAKQKKARPGSFGMSPLHLFFQHYVMNKDIRSL